MIKRIINIKDKVVSTTVAVGNDESGAEFVQILIGALIAVLLGATILHFADSSFSELGGLLVNKIKSTFSL